MAFSNSANRLVEMQRCAIYRLPISEAC
ncbi:hypothetical protein L1R36_26890, partial [Klebsiella pneumoniae]